MDVKIRYNQDNTTDLHWRLLINDRQHLVSSVTIHTPTVTTRDEVAPGVFKCHITCVNPTTIEFSVDEKDVVIN